MFNIQAIKIKNGFFINVITNNWRCTNLDQYMFNEQTATVTHDQNWFHVNTNNTITNVKKKVPGKFINERYELNNPELESVKIPLIIPYEDVEVDDDDWYGKYADLQSLYKLVRDKTDETWEDIEFTFNIIMEIDIDSTTTSFSYPIETVYNRYSDELNVKYCTEKNIEHQIIDRIIWPSVLLKEKPSRLSSEETYKIIRKHIQDNIDPKVSKITSDFNFCFTVEKKINTSEHNILLKKDSVKVFEMTHDKEKYKGYTVIKGFSGTSHENLKENIDKYLHDLMEKINTPFVECPHCKGLGIISL